MVELLDNRAQLVQKAQEVCLALKGLLVYQGREGIEDQEGRKVMLDPEGREDLQEKREKLESLGPQG